MRTLDRDSESNRPFRGERLYHAQLEATVNSFINEQHPKEALCTFSGILMRVRDQNNRCLCLRYPESGAQKLPKSHDGEISGSFPV